MKGCEYSEYMTLKEWKRWKNNTSKIKEKISYVLKKDYNSFEIFIKCSFVWTYSKEGHNYWEKIAERKEPLTK